MGTRVEDAHDVDTTTEGEVAMSNLHIDITDDDVKSFFEPIGFPKYVHINSTVLDDGNGSPMRQGLVTFKSPSEMKNALKLRGNLLLNNPIYLTPHGNDRETFFISGYDQDLSVDDVKEQIRNHFKKCGTIVKFFFPKNSDNGSFLGFCYILLDEANSEDNTKALDQKFNSHGRF